MEEKTGFLDGILIPKLVLQLYGRTSLRMGLDIQYDLEVRVIMGKR